MMITATRQLLSIYAISALFSGGRMFVGAISLLYVLSHGLSIEEFAWIKSIQVIVLLVLDIPTGFAIKKIGYKNSLILTFAFSILGLILYLAGGDFITFAIAEFVTALSLCFCPPAFASYIMSFLQKHPSILVEKVFHKSDMFAHLSILVLGAIGGYFYTLGRAFPYLAGVLVQSLGLYLVWKIPRELELGTSFNNVEMKSSLIAESWKYLKLLDKRIWIPTLILFSIQLTIQPLNYYWQPFFHEINPQISVTLLSYLFMSYYGCAILLNWFFSHAASMKFFRSMECVLVLMMLSSFFYYLTAFTQVEMVACIGFTCLLGVLSTTLTCVSAMVNQCIDQTNRPVILKLISFLSRTGMLAAFGYIQWFGISDNGSGMLTMSIHQMYQQAAFALLVSVIACGALYYYFGLRERINILP